MLQVNLILLHVNYTETQTSLHIMCDQCLCYSISEKSIRPKEKYALFPVTCPNFLRSVGRQTFFYKNFFVWKKYENP